MGSKAPIKPPALRPGDTIGVIAPASGIQPAMLRKGLEELQSLGFRVRHRDDITAVERYSAGTLDRRRKEFRQMLDDPEVAAIFCARGGYGSGHLLPSIDLAQVRARPKIFCGASDITMLLAAYHRAGVVAFHGPMVATTLREGPAGYDRTLLGRLLVEGQAVAFPLAGTEILRPGDAEGTLVGGCLSLVVSTLGTPWEIDTTGAILTLEDANTRPYQVDRMLTQLKQAGKLERVAGVVFGEMPGCEQHPQQGYSIQDVISGALAECPGPVLFGFPTGHSVRPNAILPFGVRARLALGAEPVFELLEPAVR